MLSISSSPALKPQTPKQFQTQFARSLSPSAPEPQDVLVKTVYFGEETPKESKKPVLPPPEEVMELKEILEKIQGAPFQSAFESTSDFAKAMGSDEWHVDPFTFGVMDLIESGLQYMPEVRNIEQMNSLPIEEVRFPTTDSKKTHVDSKRMTQNALNALTGRSIDLSKVNLGVVLSLFDDHLSKWNLQNELLIPNSATDMPEMDLEEAEEPQSPKEQPKVAPKTESKETKTWGNKVKNYFSLSNPFLSNPLTHVVMGLVAGSFPPPLFVVTIPMALLIGFSLASALPPKSKTKTPDLTEGVSSQEEIKLTLGDGEVVTGQKPSVPLLQLLTAYASQDVKSFKLNFHGFFDLLKQCTENPEGVPREVLAVAKRVQALQTELTEKIDSGQALLKGVQSSPEEFREKLYKLYNADIKKISKERHEFLEKQITRLESLPAMSHESAGLEKQIDIILNLPTESKSLEHFNPSQAKDLLDAEHYGLEKVKRKILSHLGAEHFVKGDDIDPKDKKPKIICLLGPPGVGKTSIGASIASATGRDFQKISLGGVNMKHDITGHTKTFVGSDSGRIIEALSKAGSDNPVIMLDEVDKLGKGGSHGDPSAALLEVLNSDNTGFRDDFIETPVDLSKVMFVCTANDINEINPILRDRMEFIALPGYISEEKIEIATRHVIPKTRRRYGLTHELLTQKGLLEKSKDTKNTAEPFSFSPSVLKELITQGYSPGLGVRSLERAIDEIGQTFASQLTEKQSKKELLTPKDFDFLKSVQALREQGFIERPPSPIKPVSKDGRIGVVNGLYYSAGGARSGGTLPVTVDVIPTKGKTNVSPGSVNTNLNLSTEEEIKQNGFSRGEILGNLQEVMKESVRTATGYIENNWNVLTPYLAEEYQDKHLKLNFSFDDLGIPKDGPSATAAITIAIISALTKTPIPGDFAMTGEMGVRGALKAIGGVREKVTGAREEGVTHIIIPKENQDDYDADVPSVVKKEIANNSAEHITDVMETLWGETNLEMVDAFKKKSQKFIVPATQKVAFSGALPSSSAFLKVVSHG